MLPGPATPFHGSSSSLAIVLLGPGENMRRELPFCVLFPVPGTCNRSRNLVSEYRTYSTGAAPGTSNLHKSVLDVCKISASRRTSMKLSKKNFAYHLPQCAWNTKEYSRCSRKARWAWLSYIRPILDSIEPLWKSGEYCKQHALLLQKEQSDTDRNFMVRTAPDRDSHYHIVT